MAAQHLSRDLVLPSSGLKEVAQMTKKVHNCAKMLIDEDDVSIKRILPFRCCTRGRSKWILPSALERLAPALLWLRFNRHWFWKKHFWWNSSSWPFNYWGVAFFEDGYVAFAKSGLLIAMRRVGWTQ